MPNAARKAMLEMKKNSAEFLDCLFPHIGIVDDFLESMPALLITHRQELADANLATKEALTNEARAWVECSNLRMQLAALREDIARAERDAVTQ